MPSERLFRCSPGLVLSFVLQHTLFDIRYSAYETLPAGTYVRVGRGETLYVHCYAHNFSPETMGCFHHTVRVLYW